MNVTISKVTQSDLPECLDVIHRSFRTVAEEFGLTQENCPKHTSFIPLSFLETQMKWDWQMYALCLDEKIIGYMSLSSEADDAFELHNLAVLPEHRHHGFGKLLLEHAKNAVQSLGGKVIRIGIIKESTVLKNWYIAIGFIHTGTRKYDHLPLYTAKSPAPSRTMSLSLDCHCEPQRGVAIRNTLRNGFTRRALPSSE